MSKHTKKEVVKKYKKKIDKVDKKLVKADKRLAKRNEKKKEKFTKKYEKKTTKLNEAVGAKGPSKFVGKTPKEKSSSKRVDKLEKKKEKIQTAGRKAYKAAESSNNYGTMKTGLNMNLGSKEVNSPTVFKGPEKVAQAGGVNYGTIANMGHEAVANMGHETSPMDFGHDKFKLISRGPGGKSGITDKPRKTIKKDTPKVDYTKDERGKRLAELLKKRDADR